MADAYEIRPMAMEDIDQIMAIEHASFPVPWTRETFMSEIDQNPYAHYFVIEKDDVVFGYCGVWLIIDEAHITNVAILPEYRGSAYGEKLFGHVFDYAISHGAVQMSLEVRVSNVAAQRLYRKFGLVPGGIRKNYYTDDGEDAVVMWVGLS
ncbi:ribosomal protein S18-alanine N-acetyltransferase [Thalassobacillus sp. CUG 92003]|uniref:ribosomal protein S18-alanine N-acetyltransferase n=1 Tax=Thalassobacillus sp. CUG 92003 TaxID=2736641 RepID=UPI0015E65EBC|nr:ribosomal protein S18-alanine N-acetyltransferase [Thalassobacillus sp. CUG 92003]